VIKLPSTFRAIVHVVFMLILLSGGWVGAQNWQSRNRSYNERHAATILKTLTSAEADFRANDRDGNGVNDFWTADVAGLHYLKFRGAPIALIPKEVADADASPLRATDFEPIPYHGYYFAALVTDESTTPRGVYRQETDGKGGKVHNLTQFGFCAFPAEPGVSGRYVIIINENNSLFYYHDWTGPPPTAWPDDNERKARLWRHCGTAPKSGESGQAAADARSRANVPRS